MRGFFYVIIEGAPSVYLDLAAAIPNFKEGGLSVGLSSFAFHPQFSTNGKFYTVHSERPNSGTADLSGPININKLQQGVITEWTASDATANEFTGTKRELLRIDIPRDFHTLQDMAFNPNAGPEDADYGNLYICLGDGGSVFIGIPRNTHRLDSILGTIFRIDPLALFQLFLLSCLPQRNHSAAFAFRFPMQ